MKPEQAPIRRNQSLKKQNGGSANMIWSIVGGAALVAIAAVVIISIPDIKRYIKISTM